MLTSSLLCIVAGMLNGIASFVCANEKEKSMFLSLQLWTGGPRKTVQRGCFGGKQFMKGNKSSTFYRKAPTFPSFADMSGGLLAVPTERLVVTRMPHKFRWWLCTSVGIICLALLAFPSQFGFSNKVFSSAVLTKSQSSSKLLFICFTAAQLTCCGVLGGQCFNRPQQGPVSQPTLLEPVPGFCSV